MANGTRKQVKCAKKFRSPYAVGQRGGEMNE